MNAGSIGRDGSPLRTACRVLASAVCYFVATRVAWSLCFPDSKVCLFFPPHAVLVSILLLVPTRQWWAYVVAAAGAHFIATQQAHWPPLYALHCEAFDAAQHLATAAGLRILIRSPLKALTLRDAIVFVVVAVVIVPFGTAFWGAAMTVYHRFGTHYWIEWRNLGVSNAVTAVVLVPGILLGAHHLFVKRPRVPRERMLEATLIGACMVAVGLLVFDQMHAGAGTSAPLLYTPIPLLIWAALRFGLGGTSAVMLIISVQAIAGTMRGHGPFLAQSPAENALALQLFLLMIATPLMLLAVVIEAEKRGQSEIQQKRAELAHVARVAVVGELTATLTHELKQPLTAIAANAGLGVLILDDSKPDIRGARDTFREISEITCRAGDLITRLREMLKRDTPGFASLDVNHVIRTVERIVSGDAVLHGVRVELDLAPGVFPVNGDAVQLQQVMLNLMLNAFSAMQDRPHDARHLLVHSASPDGSYVRIEVRDAGTGIAPDKLQSIFDPFVTTKRDGLGMGLSICRSIVQNHGGTIAAANNADGGATFSITLPVTLSALQRDPRATPPRPQTVPP